MRSPSSTIAAGRSTARTIVAPIRTADREPDADLLDLDEAEPSEKTVGNHQSNVFMKLQGGDRATALVRAREAGLGGA